MSHSWDIKMDGDDCIDQCSKCLIKKRTRYLYMSGGMKKSSKKISEYFINGEWVACFSKDERINCKVTIVV